VNSAIDSLLHGAFQVRHDDGLAAVAPRLDHAPFVAMTGLVADGVAKARTVSSNSSRCGRSNSSTREAGQGWFNLTLFPWQEFRRPA
jgi:hypothetical protein